MHLRVLIIVFILGFNLTQANDYSLIGIDDYAENDYVAKKTTSENNKDPHEKFNRKVFKFNKKVDEKIAKPVAKTYRKIVPSELRKVIRNIFNHVDDLFVISNNILQAKPKKALESFSRFVYNSTFGLLGIFDAASHMGLPKQNEDFGQTLGRWGVKPGRYLVLPFYGHTSVRDLVGSITHFLAGNSVKANGKYILNPAKNMGRNTERIALNAIWLVDYREAYLDAEDVLDTFVIDQYTAVREGYLQRRRYLVHDGKIKSTEEFDVDITDDEDELLADKPDILVIKKSPKSNQGELEDIIADDEELAN